MPSIETFKNFLVHLNIPEPFYCEKEGIQINAAWKDYVLQMAVVPDFTVICTKKVGGEAGVCVFREDNGIPSDTFREFIKDIVF